MGSGASAESARTTVTHMLSGKPADASDITDLEQARAEIRNLRRIATDFQNQLRDEMKQATGHNTAKKREAVYDKGDVVSVSSYVPKIINKSQTIKDLLLGVVTTNILFSSYTQDEHSAIVDAFESKEVANDVFVIRQGESGDHFYVVQAGTLDIYVKNKDGKEAKVGNSLGPGACFGELALMYNTPRAASIKSTSDCMLWEIDRASYRGILVYYKYLRNKQYLEFLRNVEIMEKKLGTMLSESDLEKMTVALEREVFEKGEIIIRQGNTGDQFYIIAEGDVGVYRADDGGAEKKLTVLHQGGYFGEKALLGEDVRQASCRAESKVTALTLGRDDFIDMMGTMDEIMKATDERGGASPEKPVVKALVEEKEGAVDSFLLDLKLEDFDIRSTLGCGAFGRVKLCRLPKTDQYYALKCQAKRSIVESGLQEHVLNEMRVMRKLNHPYIAKLYIALQDKQYIYFVLELLQGGELFTHLRNRGKLSEQTARFYAATVVYAFSTLHAKKIAYRDLKPENLVMDTNGYVKLVDFGLAKQLLSGKTWTLCGTPDYLAPEIILNEGHDLAVDYWALGVLIYEMVVGAPPFYAEDPMEVYEKILSGNPAMPTFFTRNLSDLCKKLLRSQQGKRLGNTRGGTAAVVKHKWFSSFDWAAIESGDAKAPYTPTIKGKDDVTNFDQFDEGDIPPVSDWMPSLDA
ncbi:kinase-like domain-containing protein [Ochromonadaceae sp. CCMP2298]|nr:kinase-like domain-containing protein [Ochromonadaceae sp. CCMP2298]|mmetsp:Transcript_30444/g.67327  ORF Transcript_30444/g.67327 Transcript_30444/m.67327 type:complete len:691 (+) Transcript_30444:118-2190(+)